MEEILTDAGIHTVLTGVRIPRMNSIMERWAQSCRHELLDRCLLWNERHLRHALREYEEFYNQHRAHQALAQAAPLRAVPDPITDSAKIIDLDIRRRDRLGGVLHEYLHAAW
ncbi:integrase core domain-containing protein [Nonomuraea sp. M3C6]|uniref:Integrase core domain-containing protein n=1 Tax=Nonomuraea marmarensis TaxID=3351344 RepID=A0ABW7AY04_9ACTN